MVHVRDEHVKRTAIERLRRDIQLDDELFARVLDELDERGGAVTVVEPGHCHPRYPFIGPQWR
jgi:hypothetical protein